MKGMVNRGCPSRLQQHTVKYTVLETESQIAAQHTDRHVTSRCLTSHCCGNTALPLNARSACNTHEEYLTDDATRLDGTTVSPGSHQAVSPMIACHIVYQCSTTTSALCMGVTADTGCNLKCSADLKAEFHLCIMAATASFTTKLPCSRLPLPCSIRCIHFQT